MKRTTIILLFLCVLIALPAHAGFKDKFISTIKNAAGSGTAALITYAGINRYYAQYAQKNADPAATARANALFKEYGILQNKQVPVVLGKSPSAYASVTDAYIIVPKPTPHSYFNFSSPAEFDYITTMLHEAGHYANNHTLWTCIIASTTAGAAQSFAKSLRGKSGLTLCCSFLSSQLVARKFERDADRYSIEHSRYPAHLEAQAKAFCSHHDQEQADIKAIEKKISDLSLYPKTQTALRYLLKASQIVHNIRDVHPSNLERAEYFKKAAAELRAKQSKKS